MGLYKETLKQRLVEFSRDQNLFVHRLREERKLNKFLLTERGKILGEPTPLATNRKKRQARTRWHQVKPTMAASIFSPIRMDWLEMMRNCRFLYKMKIF
ncbi:hypothetical protein TNCV_4035051 [Trichonephila clavipes]|nr:hypothetical protein TNCV_4035051 [Trichonephila clavipes]